MNLEDRINRHLAQPVPLQWLGDSYPHWPDTWSKPCWTWLGAHAPKKPTKRTITTKFYGRRHLIQAPRPIMNIDGRPVRVIRVLFEFIAREPLRAGLQIRLRCGNGSCINPTHHRVLPMIDRKRELPLAPLPARLRQYEEEEHADHS